MLNNFNVLPFYGSLEKQNHRRPYAFGQAYPLIASTKSLLPFQVTLDLESNSEVDFFRATIIYLDNSAMLRPITQEFLSGSTILPDESSGKSLVTWQAPELLLLAPGLAYLSIVDRSGVSYYSEVFCLVDDLSKYIRLDWWDNDSEGNPGFVHTVYIDSMVGKPKYELEEEGTDRDGYFFVEKQISKKIHKFSFVAPEYLCDALRVVPMADNIRITFNGGTYDCDRIVIDVDWEEQGDLAAVEVEFTTGTVVKKIAAGWPK